MDLDKLKNCRRLKNRQEFLMQYKALFVAPNRVQLGLAVANDEGKKLLESLLDNYFELIDLLQADAFVKGFKLGGKLAREIFD